MTEEWNRPAYDTAEERSQVGQVQRLVNQLIQRGLRGEQLLNYVQQLLGPGARLRAAQYLQQVLGAINAPTL